MPRTTLEILRTRTVTTEQRIEVEVDVPQRVLNDGDRLHEWVEKQLMNRDSELFTLAEKDDNVEVADELESDEINEVTDLGPES
jgi:hypothetical protein